MLTCRLPLPAWPKLTIGSDCARASRVARRHQVRDARDRHHHVLVDLARRPACAAPATAPCVPPKARSRAASSAAASSDRQPSPPAACAARRRRRRARSASPSASIISSAPASVGQVGAADVAGQAHAVAVHELEHRRRDRLRHQPGDRAAAPHRRRGYSARSAPALRRQRRQLQRGLDDQGQGAFLNRSAAAAGRSRSRPWWWRCRRRSARRCR